LSSSLLELVCKCTVLLRNRLLDYVSPLRRHCSKIRWGGCLLMDC
jgi:hypothetical protein